MSNLPDILIRTMTMDELSRLGPLWQAAGLSYRPGGRDSNPDLVRQWRADPEQFIGAFHDAHLVGSVVATDDGRRGWINRLAIHPEYRRRRIAGRLIAAAEDMLKKKGLLIIAALIEDSNTSSRALFASTGYEFVPEVLYYSKRESPDA